MSDTPNRIQNAASMIAPRELQEAADVATTGSNTTDSISENEATALRQEKLAAIKKAVAAGAYDSEEMLEKAMARMKAAIENGEERQ